MVADHQAINQAPSTQTFLADPYCVCQRGSNEYFNGLLHQYIHKKRRMKTITDEDLTMIEKRSNPRL